MSPEVQIIGEFRIRPQGVIVAREPHFSWLQEMRSRLARANPGAASEQRGGTLVLDEADHPHPSTEAQRTTDLSRFVVPAQRSEAEFIEVLLRDVTIETSECRILAHIATASAIPAPIGAAAVSVLRYLASTPDERGTLAGRVYRWIGGERNRHDGEDQSFSRLAGLHLLRDILIREAGDIEPAPSVYPDLPWCPNPERYVLPEATRHYLGSRSVTTSGWGHNARVRDPKTEREIARMYLRSAVRASAFSEHSSVTDNVRRWCGVLLRHYEQRYGDVLLQHLALVPPRFLPAPQTAAMSDRAPRSIFTPTETGGEPLSVSLPQREAGGEEAAVSSAVSAVDEESAMDVLLESVPVGFAEIRLLMHIGSVASVPDEVTWAARAVLRRLAGSRHILHSQARRAEVRTRATTVRSRAGEERFTRLAAIALIKDLMTRRRDDIDPAGEGWRSTNRGVSFPAAFRALLDEPSGHDNLNGPARYRALEERGNRVARMYFRAGIPLVDVVAAGAAKRSIITWTLALQHQAERRLGERMVGMLSRIRLQDRIG
ncbi:hypothetical protein [Robbsia sp. KACC 23696]|uniref:hypothetical protein n=1 Tax=Robbsia sp. KACC 23696 TaxID=3149231 RepID=UPI00325C1A0A